MNDFLQQVTLTDATAPVVRQNTKCVSKFVTKTKLSNKIAFSSASLGQRRADNETSHARQGRSRKTTK